MDAIEPAPRSRSGRTNCRKDQQPYRLQAAKNQASWYCSSWRGLQSGASTPDDSRLNTPETTPPSIPTNPATASGLLPEFLKLPHQELCYVSAVIGKTSVQIGDLTHLPTQCRFIALMPQWDFLNFLAKPGA